MSPNVRIWVNRILYTFFSLIFIAVPLLPLGFSPGRLAMPDLFFALTIAWTVREQKAAPLLLVAALALLADAVLMRPVGLWALLIVISTELTRMNDKLIREGGILAELTFFGLALVAALILQNTMLFLVFSNTYPIQSLVQIVMFSLVYYTLIALFLHYVLRVRGLVTKKRPDRLGKVG